MPRPKADARHFWALSLACLVAAIAVAVLWQRLSWSLPAGSLVFAAMAVARSKSEQKAQAAPALLTTEPQPDRTVHGPSAAEPAGDTGDRDGSSTES